MAELQLINSVQAGLASRMDFQGLIELVGKQLNQYLQPHLIGIALYDPVSQTISTPYWVSGDQRYEEDNLPLGEGIVSTVIQTGKPLRLDTRAEMEAHNARYPSDISTEHLPEEMSWLGVPLLDDQGVMGVIFTSRPFACGFDESDQNLLSTLAFSLSVTLQNARLFAETWYRFTQPVTLELSYNSMLFSQRRQLHRLVAEWYEQHDGEEGRCPSEALTRHWLKAGEPMKALSYLEKAGQEALQRGDYADAERLFQACLELESQAAVLEEGDQPESEL